MPKEKVQLTIVVIGFVDSDVPTTTNMKTAEKEIQKGTVARADSST